MGEMIIPVAAQEEKVVWDKTKGEEVEAAKKRFDELISLMYFAYSVSVVTGRERLKAIYEFDENAEKIILGPPMVGG